MIDLLSRLYTLMGPVWTAGLTGAWAAAIVLLLRLILKNRVPRQILCLLWLVVFARLALPFSLQSPVSLVPARVTEDIPARVEQFTGRIDPLPQGGQTVLTPDQLVKPDQTGPQTQTGVTAPSAPSAPSSPAPRQFPLRAALAGVWLAGLAAMLGYALFSYLRLKRKLFDAIRTRYGAWEHPCVGSPFILGVLCPRIYVPAGVSGDTRRFILCHERAHLERGDHIVKPLCWLILAVHWFNPAAWAAFLLLSRDMEAACDERVLRVLGEDVKADYSSTLLSLATEGRFPAPSPLAFDEGDAGSRIKNVLRYHRPAVAAVIVGVIAVALAAVCLLTSPVRADPPEGGDPLENTAPTTDLSEILDKDQLAVYRQAEELYLRLFGGDTTEINTDGYSSADPFDYGIYTYLPATGEYADWSVFDAAVHARFTDRFWTERNNDADRDIPFFIEHDGRTYYLDVSLADRLVHDDSPSIYTLVSETADAVEFTITDRFYPDEGDALTLVFSVRLERTTDGWRVDEMRSPKSAIDRGQARQVQLTAPVLTDTAVTALDAGEDGLYHQFRLTHGGRSVTFSGSAESGGWPNDMARIISAALSDGASGGQKQLLAAILRVSHGTGVLAEELHLFDPDTLEEYDCSGVVDEALGRLGSYSDDENYYITVSGEPLAAVSRAEWPGGLSFLFFDEYYSFEARDGQLYLVLAAGYSNGPTYCGEVRARLGLDGRRAVCLDYAYVPGRDEPAPDPETRPKEYLLDLLDRGFANGGWQGWYFIFPGTGPMTVPAEAEPLKALFSSLDWTYQGTEDDAGTLSNYWLLWDDGDHPVRVELSEEGTLLGVTALGQSTSPTRLLFRAEGTDDLSASILALCPDPWLDFGRVTVPFGEDAEATARRFLREALALYQREGNATEFEAEASDIQKQEGGDILYKASIALKPADPGRAFWRGKLDGDGWYRTTFTVCLISDPNGGDFYVIGWMQ